YPNHNVGIVGTRGAGNLVFLDIDSDGVVERIEQQTGRTMPATYVVQSRPQSAPYKRHFYFRQTEYSVQHFTKEINVKDLTKTNKEGKPSTLYDLKGCGGGGFVVAAWSIRENGERYTAIDEATPVVPIPDWLVDWIAADVKHYRSERAKSAHKQGE